MSPEKSNDNHGQEKAPENPTPAVKEISKVDAVHLLATGHGHDEVHIGYFEKKQTEKSQPEKRFHFIQLMVFNKS